MKVLFINGDTVEYPTAGHVVHPSPDADFFMLFTERGGSWVATLPAQNVLSLETGRIRQNKTPEGIPVEVLKKWWDEFEEQAIAAKIPLMYLFGVVLYDYVTVPVDRPRLRRPDVILDESGNLPTFRDWCQAIVDGKKDKVMLDVSGIGSKTLEHIKEAALRVLEESV